MSERLAGMPRSWGRNPTRPTRLRQHGAAFWILAIVLVLGTIYGIANTVATTVAGGVAVGMIALLLWVIWTVVGAWLVGLVDVYRFVPWSIQLALLLWGAFVGTSVSGLLEGLVPPFLGRGYTTAVTAGLFEEGFKVLGVILVAASVPLLFRRPMGALICAMITGLGFSFSENLGDGALTLVRLGENAGIGQQLVMVGTNLGMRGFVNGAVAHLAFAAVAAMGVFYYVSRRSDRTHGHRLGVAVGLFLGAALLHVVNDMPLTSSVVGQVFNNVVQLAVFVWLIVYAVRAERRWLTGATANADPVITATEAPTLRTHRTRRTARAGVSDRVARGRIQTRQWAQIGYVAAVADGAPDFQTERLASYTAILRSPAGTGKIPGPRRPAPSDERQSTTDY